MAKPLPQTVRAPLSFQLIVLDGRRKFLQSRKVQTLEALFPILALILKAEVVQTVSIRKLNPKANKVAHQ